MIAVIRFTPASPLSYLTPFASAPAVVADHEDVVVGDGAEGLVLHCLIPRAMVSGLEGEAFMPINRPPLLLITIFAVGLAMPHRAAAEPTDENLTIEDLLKGGWQIAGYAGAFDNWSTFILLRHPDQPYLVQCRSGYDVTRQPRTQSHCYKLH